MLYLLPLITVLIWSGNAIVNKLAAPLIDPGAISLYRWVVSVLILTPFMLKPIWKSRKLIIPNLPKLAFLAFLGLVLNQSLGYYAGHYTTATNMALITSLVPLIALFMSIKLLNQKLTFPAVGGAILSLLGLLFMLSHGDIKSLFEQGFNQGDVLVLVAAIVYALYCVLVKRWPMPISNWQSVYIQASFAVLMLTPMWAISDNKSLDAQTIPLVLYAGFFASVLAPWLWMTAINGLGADKTSMFMNLMPVMTAIIASFSLGEQLTHEHYIGIALVLLGVMIAQIRYRFGIRKVSPSRN